MAQSVNIRVKKKERKCVCVCGGVILNKHSSKQGFSSFSVSCLTAKQFCVVKNFSKIFGRMCFKTESIHFGLNPAVTSC